MGERRDREEPQRRRDRRPGGDRDRIRRPGLGEADTDGGFCAGVLDGLELESEVLVPTSVDMNAIVREHSEGRSVARFDADVEPDAFNDLVETPLPGRRVRVH